MPKRMLKVFNTFPLIQEKHIRCCFYPKTNNRIKPKVQYASWQIAENIIQAKSSSSNVYMCWRNHIHIGHMPNNVLVLPRSRS